MAGRIHSITRRLNSVGRRIPSILAVYTQLISFWTWPYTLHPSFFPKNDDSISPNASRVYSAPPYTLHSEDPGTPHRNPVPHHTGTPSHTAPGPRPTPHRDPVPHHTGIPSHTTPKPMGELSQGGDCHTIVDRIHVDQNIEKS